MKHTITDLVHADWLVTKDITQADNMGEALSDIAEPGAVMQLVHANVRSVIVARDGDDEPVNVVAAAAMVYGFMWGYKLATHTRERAA